MQPDTFRSLLAGLTTSFASVLANAEILHDVFPFESLKQIKSTYPKASFTALSPAWLKENQAFYSMSGSGFPGTLMLIFDDSRTLGKDRYLALNCDSDVERSDLDKRKCDVWRSVKNRPVDDALTISWVRWVPAAPIPIDRYKSRYGEPTKVEFSPMDMTPYAEWTSIALTAQLSDDKRLVLYVDTAFTKAEYRAAWKAFGEYLPENLREPGDDTAGPTVKQGPKRK